MINVTVYYRQNEPESQNVIDTLQSLSDRYPHNLIRVDIETDGDLQQRFAGQTPAVRVGPYLLRKNFTQADLEVALGAARDRADRLTETEDQGYQRRIDRGRNFSTADRIVNWFSHHYLMVFNLFLFLYVGLPIAAPVLMKEGLSGPANFIYTIYSPLCHQLAFRSFFLFGEQPDYPRLLAGVSGATTYEAMMGLDPTANEKTDAFILDARAFLGNDTVGYKMAICERDVAMYASLLLFGLTFAVSGKKIKSVKWYIWLIVGVVPIAVDGFSQLPSLLVGLPDIINRESTPFLRVLTGALFGIMTAWYLFPLIEESMKETRSMYAYKKVVVDQLPKKD
jgi:uncharacterized membrane protein